MNFQKVSTKRTKTTGGRMINKVYVNEDELKKNRTVTTVSVCNRWYDKPIFLTDCDPFENVRKVLNSKNDRIIANGRSSKSVPLDRVMLEYALDLENEVKKTIQNFDKGVK